MKKYLLIILLFCSVVYAATEWSDMTFKGTVNVEGVTTLDSDVDITAGPVVVGGSTADGAAIIDVQSTTQGSIAIPKMTEAQKNAISTPPEGLTVYDTTNSDLYFYDGSSWEKFGQPAVDASSGIPSGTLAWYSGTSAPSGWLVGDGSAVNRTTYAALYAVTGNAFGQGDGSTTFNLPDCEGRFIRGRDNAAGTDPDAGSRTAMATGGNTGDNVGSVQADAMQGHQHTYTKEGGSGSYSGGIVGSEGGTNNTSSPVTDGVNGTPRTSSETRPKNFYMTCIIKI